MTNQDSRVIAEELEQLKQDGSRNADVVGARLRLALVCRVGCNPILLTDVIVGDSAIDDLQKEVAERCLELIALHQPVAVDLRTVVSTLKISDDMERVGD